MRYAREEAVKKRTGHVHNTPLQILMERRVLGLTAWGWLWVAFYAGAIRRLRRPPADTGFPIDGLSEYNFGDSEVVLVAWVIMAPPWAARGEPSA